MNVSVIIPTFNRRHLLGEAIDSALAQECSDMAVEVIVVDENSRDGTLDWLGATYWKDARVRIFSNCRIAGPAGARNSGILAARFPCIAFLDPDDSFLPGHLSTAVDVFRQYPEVQVIFGRARYERDGAVVARMGTNFEKKIRRAPTVAENENAWVLGPGFFSHLLEEGCYFNPSTVALRADAARQLMAESLRIGEDYEFWTRLARTCVFACLKTPQIVCRFHADNPSQGVRTDPARNAPMLLHAYNLMLAYPDLTAVDRRRIRARIAQEYFDWAWRCGRDGAIFTALMLNLKSLRHGLMLRNLAAILKLPLTWRKSQRSPRTEMQ
ncbi:MAG: glycosyltransferase [Azoarcus sp.]|jgi:glycosyltransferase involved in cell wall biosynthesis|nr:glycosyltransferase [Azoarcus sp.]